MYEASEYDKMFDKGVPALRGRPRKIKDAKELYEIFARYLTVAREDYWLKEEVVKGGPSAGQIITTKVRTPLSVLGFCVFAGITFEGTFYYMLNPEKANTETRGSHYSGHYEEYCEVARFIRNTCNRQQYDGAAVGAYNANIVARGIGLADKTEVTGQNGGPVQVEQITGMVVK
jgi:hypothetical protein